MTQIVFSHREKLDVSIQCPLCNKFVSELPKEGVVVEINGKFEVKEKLRIKICVECDAQLASGTIFAVSRRK